MKQMILRRVAAFLALLAGACLFVPTPAFAGELDNYFGAYDSPPDEVLSLYEKAMAAADDTPQGYVDRAHATACAAGALRDLPNYQAKADELIESFHQMFWPAYEGLMAQPGCGDVFVEGEWAFRNTMFEYVRILMGKGDADGARRLHDFLFTSDVPWVAACREGFEQHYPDEVSRLHCYFASPSAPLVAIDGYLPNAWPAVMDCYGYYRVDLYEVFAAMGIEPTLEDGALRYQWGDLAYTYDVDRRTLIYESGDLEIHTVPPLREGDALLVAVEDLEHLAGFMVTLESGGDGAPWAYKLEQDPLFVTLNMTWPQEHEAMYGPLLQNMTLLATTTFASQLSGQPADHPDTLVMLRPLSGWARSAEMQEVLAQHLKENEGFDDPLDLDQQLAYTAQQMLWADTDEEFVGYAARAALLVQYCNAANWDWARSASTSCLLSAMGQMILARFESLESYRDACRRAGVAAPDEVYAAYDALCPLTDADWQAMAADAGDGSGPEADLCSLLNLSPAAQNQAQPELVDPATTQLLAGAGAALRVLVCLLLAAAVGFAAWQARRGRLWFWNSRWAIMQNAWRCVDRLAQLAGAAPEWERERMARLCQNARGVWQTVRFKPARWPAARRFLRVYLPVTVHLLQRWQASPGGLAAHDGELAVLDEAFARQLDTLFGPEALDVTVELETLLEMLQADDLTADALRAELRRQQKAAR